jgi:cytochrome P450
MDFVEDFAGPLTGRTIGNMLGMTNNEWDDVARWMRPSELSGRQSTAFAAVVRFPRAANGLRHMREFLFETLLPRTPPGSAPLLDGVRQRLRDETARKGEEHGRAAAFSDFASLVAGGTGTTKHLITNGMRVLATQPHIRKALRSGKISVTQFRQEVTCWDSPAQVLLRFATRDTSLRGVSVAAGTQIALVVGAANRDPSVFENPNHFDPTRWDSAGKPVPPGATAPPLTFGDGVHFCPGMTLAGIEADIAWMSALKHMPDARIIHAETLRTEAGIKVGGYTHLPIKFKSFKLELDPLEFQLSNDLAG